MKVLAIILCALVVLGGIATAALYYSPQATAITALVGATKDFTKRAEILPLTNMLKEGSLEYSMAKSNDAEAEPYASGKIFFSKDAIMYKDFVVNDADLKLAGSAYFSEDLIYVSGEHIIGGVYGVNPSKFTSDLSNSIFAADSGSKYAIEDDGMYDAIIRSGENLDLRQMNKDAEKLIETYERELWLIVCEYAEFDSNFKKVDLNGVKKKVRVITVTVDREAAANIVRDAYKYLDYDQQILDFAKIYESVFALLYGEMYDDSEYGSLAEAIEQDIDNLEEDVEEFCKKIEESENFRTLELEVVTQTFSAKLLEASFKMNGVTAMTLDLGELGMKKTDQITLSVIQDVTDDYELVYTMKQYYDRSVATLKCGEEKLISVTINKVRNTFKLEAEDFILSGSIKTVDGTTTLVIDKVSETIYSTNGVASTEETQPNIRIVIRQQDEMPEAPSKYNRLQDITEQDVDRWDRKLREVLDKISLEKVE